MIFVVCFDYDYMCSETDFTQETSHFYPTTRIPYEVVEYIEGPLGGKGEWGGEEEGRFPL